MERKEGLAKYFWRVTYAHTIAYFIAGIFAVVFMDYDGLWALPYFSFMRPLDSPVIALGPVFQILRGFLYALVFLPLRKQLFGKKYGLAKLGLLLFGLTYLLTFGPGIGSFEGYIYTVIPVRYQMRGIPEMLLWLLLFVAILHVSAKYAHKKIVTVMSAVIMVLIVLMGIAGFASMHQTVAAAF